MAELLNQDKEMAASFLNSVLNQLNWAFSEFIGMIQEVRKRQSKKPMAPPSWLSSNTPIQLDYRLVGVHFEAASC